METSEDLIPSWINNSFLETALRSSEEVNPQVTSYQVTLATSAGDNYSSQMFRVQVHFKRRNQLITRSIILKAEPSGCEMAKIVAEEGVFQKESTALATIIPKIHTLIQEATPEKIPSFGAQCFYSHFGPPSSVIVLEDLKVGGFRMAERTKGLDKKHCFLVLRTLAKYHAASVIKYKQDPELFKVFDNNLYNEDVRSKVLEPFFGNGVKIVAKKMENWSEFDDRFSKQLRKISEVAVTYLIQYGKKQDGELNVLNHGDLWLNNMMFRYSDTTGQVEEVRFVDFPQGNIGNPAMDLLYFLHTSPSIELMNQHHILLEEYHKTLCDTFTLLGYKHYHPTLQQLKGQIDRMGMYAVVIACTLLPIVLSDEVPDIEKIWNNEQGICYSERYRNVLKILIPIFEKNGWLNIEKYFAV